uniref:Uncharacterized protein n=1 Tax=Strigamia maritima TaxID=126957 RepID=T1J9Z5_STRMM
MIRQLSVLLFLVLQIGNVLTGGFGGHHHPQPNPQSYTPKPRPATSKPHHHQCQELKGWWESESHLIMYIIEDVPRSFVVTFDGFFFKSEEK